MIIRDYKLGEKIEENEYLLKIRKSDNRKGVEFPPTGFLTKLTQKGQLPKAFEDWGKTYSDPTPPTYVFKESFNSGWKIMSWRFGQSQNWATMRHPHGFTVEIYLQQLLEIIQENTINAGVLTGEYKWKDHKLIKRT